MYCTGGAQMNTQTRTFDEKLAAFAAATNNDLYDPHWEGGTWMVPAVETHETLQDFEDASCHWAECSTPTLVGNIGGFPAIGWRRVQPHKGSQCGSLVVVVDFGDRRVSLDADPADHL